MPSEDLLTNYDHLVAKIDAICRRIHRTYGSHMACQKGCADCCRHISVFPVEAAALSRALNRLPRDEVAAIRDVARLAAPSGTCPLLKNNVCRLYDHRPIICRTHGFPVLVVQAGRQSVDFCPLNFKGRASLPGDAVISLEPLNAALATISRVFTADAKTFNFPDKRFSIAEALLLDTDC